MSTSTLRHGCNPLQKLLFNFVLFRNMGGGPRTFPGGLNKWQYKRMHEKLAKEKERRLLQQEKQIYQARLRSEIRAKLAGESPSAGSTDASSARMSSKDHVRALADRFMKEGAEDLWNEDDGPVKSQNRPRPSTYPPPKPLDLNKIVAEKRTFFGSLEHRRHYSRWSRNASSDEGDAEDFNSGVRLKEGLLNKFQGSCGVKDKGFRFPRLRIELEDSEEDSCRDGGPTRKKMVSGAALRSYDVKTNKRRAPRFDIEESDLSKEIRDFREYLSKRPSEDNEKREEMTEESLLTQKRFDECNISPLTVKALIAARYVNLTVVQEAALPLCLEDVGEIVEHVQLKMFVFYKYDSRACTCIM